MKHGSLFSGIGGFDLAAEWMGWDNQFHCEWNEFCQKVLNYYWPNAESFKDITKTDFTKYANRIDILTGGFPCQPYSTAGKRLGKEDERHLWPEMLRAIREIRPRWIVGENVRGLISWNGGLVFDEVQADLEAEGYEVIPFLLPACAVNAPHRRDRIWFVAYSDSNDARRCRFRKAGKKKANCKTKEEKRERVWTEFERAIKKGTVTDTKRIGLAKRNAKQGWSETQPIIERQDGISGWQNFPTQPPVCNGNDGIPAGLDGITFSKWRNESIKAAGNAIVPQVAFQIFKAIEQYEQLIYDQTTD